MTRIVLACLFVVACSSKKPATAELGKPGEPFGLVADVRLGMTVDEVKQKAPELARAADNADVYGARTDGATYEVRFSNGRASKIAIQLLHRNADELAKAWGPGIDSGDDMQHYLDAAHGTRVDVMPKALSFEFVPMIPFATLLGPDGGTVQGVKLIGRPVKDVLADFAALPVVGENAMPLGTSGHGGMVKGLPATEWTRSLGAQLQFGAGADGNVESWNLMLMYDDEVTTPVLAAFEHAWGKPTEDGADTLVYGKAPAIRVDRQLLTLSVAPP